MDLPGFGESPINNKTNYDQKFFTKSIIELIKYLQIKQITLAGESIGGVLSLTVAIKIPNLVKKIYLFNPYDYDSYFAEGISRGNLFAKFIMFNIRLPIIGNFFSSLENKFILKNIMRGGFFNNEFLTDNYLDLLCSSLKKKNYVYHFRNVLSNFKSWSDCRDLYGSANLPIKLIYGSNDWSNPNDRNKTQKLLGLSDFEIIDNCGHFSFIERPMKVAQIISSKNSA